MPDLGKYAEAVLSAYAVSIVLLVGIVVLTLWRINSSKTSKESAIWLSWDPRSKVLRREDFNWSLQMSLPLVHRSRQSGSN